MNNENKNCHDCSCFNSTPVLPPCEDWQECFNNGFYYFQPNFMYKIKKFFKRMFNTLKDSF